MKKIAHILADFEALQPTHKVAFIPNPSLSGGGGGGGGQDPSVQGQDPQAQGGQGQDPQAQAGQPSPQGQDPTGGIGADAAAALQGQGGQGDPSQGGGDQGTQGKGTDLDSTMISLPLRELIDMVSGGKATATQIRINELLQKAQAKAQQTAQDQAMKEQEQAAMQQQQQQGMMGGGIYPQAPGQEGQAQPAAPAAGGM